MLSFILDTNFFVNLQRPLNLGANKEAVVENLYKEVWRLIKSDNIVLYTTPDSFRELASFFEDQPKHLGLLNNLLTVASPSLTNLKINASLFAELIAETGKRLYRGLRVAEEPLKELVNQPQTFDPETLTKKITSLREKYRRATREGFIDSTTDLGLIFLSREKGAALVSSDAGLIHWARNFGCQELLPEAFVNKMQALRKSRNSA